MGFRMSNKYLPKSDLSIENSALSAEKLTPEEKTHDFWKIIETHEKHL